MRFKFKPDFKQKIAFGLVCALVFAYTVFHIVSLFGEDVTTFAAGVTTESTVISYNGYIFKDEKVLTSSNSGLVDYLVPDGTKVGRGQQVAVVYSKGRERQTNLERIDNYISVLSDSTGDALSGVDVVAQKSQNGDTYDSLIKMLANGETGGLEFQAEKLLVGMNVVGGLANGELTAVNLLNSLRNQRKAMFSELGNGISCGVDETGYFYSGSDGCEEIFTLDAVEDITVDDFYEMVEYATEPDIEKGAYGRLGSSSEWKIVLPVDVSDVKYFKAGQTYSAMFTENNRSDLPLYLEKIVEDEEYDTALLVFQCDRQPDNFSFNRCQSVSITVNTVKGIYIPKSVVVREEGTKGVYVLRGSVVQFRYIEVLYEGSDYYLVRSDSEDEENMEYIRENDMIILTGQNLFDGRVLD